LTWDLGKGDAIKTVFNNGSKDKNKFGHYDEVSIIKCITKLIAFNSFVLF